MESWTVIGYDPIGHDDLINIILDRSDKIDDVSTNAVNGMNLFM